MFIDAHCDVLSRMLEHPGTDFDDAGVLDASVSRLKEGGALLQFFAIYIPRPFDPGSVHAIWKSIDLFCEKIVAHPLMKPVRCKGDLDDLSPGRTIGALLTLEGVDALPRDPLYIRLLHRLGVRAVGPTWNHANWAADGAMTTRGGGLTEDGRSLITECERLGILIDVSHLSDRAFYDTASIAERPFFASHSNVRDVCPHPRNLTREQIETIIEAGGCIGLTFVPYFLRKDKSAGIVDLLKHIEYICGMGGSFHLGFGSDFDGFDVPLPGLEHPGKYGTLREVLLKHYSDAETERFMYRNWYDYLHRALIL